MKLEQIYYGRGSKGYEVLGSSIPQGAISQAVVDLCGQLGTPAFESDKEDAPFLAQKHFGELVLMVYGCAGTPDVLGRGTLFFHALVGSAEEARTAGVTALSLWQDNRFTQKVPSGTVEPIILDRNVFSGDRIAGVSLKAPIAIRCKRSENLELVGRLGEEILNGNWVSFSWNLLSGFDYIGIDAARPTGSIQLEYTVYDRHFTVLRSAPEQSIHREKSNSQYSHSLRSKSLSAILLTATGIFLFALGFFVRDFLYALKTEQESVASKPKEKFNYENHVDRDEAKEILCAAKFRKNGMKEKLEDLGPKILYYIDFVNRNFSD